jgi:hypothetical protein
MNAYVQQAVNTAPFFLPQVPATTLEALCAMFLLQPAGHCAALSLKQWGLVLDKVYGYEVLLTHYFRSGPCPWAAEKAFR